MILNNIKKFIFPSRCVVCDEILPFGNEMKNEFLCDFCRDKFEFVKEPICKKCGAMISNHEELYCSKCKVNNYNDFDYGFGLFRYNDYIKISLHRIKYSGRKEYLKFYGKCLAKAFKNRIQKIEPDCFVPVPIHKKRLIQRNYNQSTVLANAISEELKRYNIEIPVNENLIFRNRNTTALNKLGQFERSEQLKNAFEVRPFDCIDKVMIIDDILTTGSTVNEIAKELKKFGVKKVYFMVISVVDNI